MFDEYLQAIHEYAKEVFPEEMVCIITPEKSISINNVHPSPRTDFLVDKHEWEELYNQNEILALVHSHNDYNHASVEDQKLQLALNIPMGIVNLKNRSIISTFFWGDSLPIEPLEGREFHQGVFDCFSVVRDYFRLNGITLPNFPREFEFWKKKGVNVIEENIHVFPFYEVDIKDSKKNDILIYAYGKRIDHMAVRLDRGLVLHHKTNKLSVTAPIHQDYEKIRFAMRYKGGM